MRYVKLTRTIHQLHQLRRQQNVQTSELDRLVVFAATHRPGDVFGQLDTGEAGLDPELARDLTGVYGKNVVEEERHEPKFKRVAAAFVSPFTLILAALAAVSVYTNVIMAAPGEADPSTAIIIGIMVLISARFATRRSPRARAPPAPSRTW